MILNQQRKVRVATQPLEEFLMRVEKELGVAKSSVTICFVSDAEIARMNDQYRGKKGPTDVLSFPLRSLPSAISALKSTRSPSRFVSRAQTTRGRKGSTDVLSLSQENSFSPLVHPERSRRATRHSPLRAPKMKSRAKLGKRLSRESGPAYLGDIAIAPETARRYAKKNGRTLDSELRVLILHGVLHLLGYDHETDRGEMDRLENKLRRTFGLV